MNDFQIGLGPLAQPGSGRGLWVSWAKDTGARLFDGALPETVLSPCLLAAAYTSNENHQLQDTSRVVTSQVPSRHVTAGSEEEYSQKNMQENKQIAFFHWKSFQV